MKKKKSQSKNKIRFVGKNRFAIILIVIALILILIGFSGLSEEPEDTGEIKVSENDSEWNTYTNKKYGFAIDFPPDWKVHEDFETVSPVINIYDPEFGQNPPFDQFSEINNVSIFPKGTDAEAIIGETVNSTVNISERIETGRDYVLENEQVWATYLNFANASQSWKPWGFVWSRSFVKNISFGCERDNKSISVDECNPFDGDNFIRRGRVSPEVREIQERILESFRFVEE